MSSCRLRRLTWVDTLSVSEKLPGTGVAEFSPCHNSEIFNYFECYIFISGPLSDKFDNVLEKI